MVVQLLVLLIMNKNEFLDIVQPFSMTSKERIFALFDSLEYIRKLNLEGDIVECGVWKGGNIFGIIEYLYRFNINNKNVWLYDTFQGMSNPEIVDVDLNHKAASDLMNLPSILAYCSLDNVKATLCKSKFDQNYIKYIVGDVSQTLTIPHNIPKNISLLRLDTDWYKSTKDELHFLYPKLVNKGILIVDDYGHWQGAKKACDEYFAYKNITISQIDYTGIKIVKNE